MPSYLDPNRNTRAPFARPDEPRDLGPEGTGDAAKDGYFLRARKPRVPDYPDFVSPARAKSIEDVYREYSDVMDMDGMIDPGLPDNDGDE